MTKNYSNFRDRNAVTSLQNEAICQNGTEKAYYYGSTSVQNLVNKIIQVLDGGDDKIRNNKTLLKTKKLVYFSLICRELLSM